MTDAPKPPDLHICDRCGSRNLTKVKGCLVCLDCRWKHD